MESISHQLIFCLCILDPLYLPILYHPVTLRYVRVSKCPHLTYQAFFFPEVRYFGSVNKSLEKSGKKVVKTLKVLPEWVYTSIL